MPTQYLELRCAWTLTHINTVTKDRIKTCVFSWLEKSKGIQHACQKSQWVQPGNTLSPCWPGWGGSQVETTSKPMNKWGGRSQERLKVMPADASSSENGLEQTLRSFKKEKISCRSLNSTGFSWPQHFPKRQCQCHLKTLWHLYFVTNLIRNPTYRILGSRSV